MSETSKPDVGKEGRNPKDMVSSVSSSRDVKDGICPAGQIVGTNGRENVFVCQQFVGVSQWITNRRGTELSLWVLFNTCLS